MRHLYSSDHSSEDLERFLWTLSERLQDYLLEGWKAYVVTFMFKPLDGKKHVVLQKMHNQVGRVYSILLTEVVRHPRSPSQQASRPILIEVPDLPVPRNREHRSNNALINGGLHCHGILLIPPRPRLKEDLIDHFKSNSRRYLRNSLLEIDIRPIDFPTFQELFITLLNRSSGADLVGATGSCFPSHVEISRTRFINGPNSQDPSNQGMQRDYPKHRDACGRAQGRHSQY